MYRLDNPPNKTSFEDFMTSKSYTKNLRITLPEQFEDCDGRPGPIKGYVYLGHYYIMWDVDLHWYLILGNEEYTSSQIHKLEKILYDFVD